MMDGNNDVVFGEMETVEVPTVAETPSDQPKQKKEIDKEKLWMILAMVFFVLAIGGVSFGVVMMLNNNQKTEELNSQVESLEERNDDLLEQLAGQMENMNTGPIQIRPVLINPASYIYVGEWGIKIKKPENAQNMVKEYVFYNDYPQALGVLELKENPEVPTSHALIINEGEVTCDSLTVQYDACFVIVNNAYIVTDLPSVDTGGVSSEFREFVLNSDNYMVI